jgi:hypothetical protein
VFVAAFLILLASGVLLTLLETKCDRGRPMNHPRISAEDKADAMPAYQRSRLIQGAVTTAGGIVAAAGTARFTRSATIVIGVGVMVQVALVMRDFLKHQRPHA